MTHTVQQEAVIFDIQRFSLHDGPGIRTTVFFKGCPLRCRWCQNPESRDPLPEMSFYRELCLGCFRCEEACPAGAITREPGNRIDYTRCTACGQCAATCPANALRRIGRKWTVLETADALYRDIDFYTDSGGGVTFSGGEPMLHPAFLAGISKELKTRGVHITLETAGHVQPSLFDALTGLIDLVYFDVKHSDSGAHRRLAGAGNELILRCLDHLLSKGFAVQPRMPVVPGLNDDADNLAGTAQLLKARGLESIHCLPYHGLGNSKLARINRRETGDIIIPPDADKMETVRSLFIKEGINAVIYT